MKKTNVYVYWFGERIPKRVLELKESLAKVRNIEVFFGPNAEEHEELKREFKYYRRALKNKKFSFASDIYSFWCMKKYGPGIYIDAAGVFPSRFEKFVEKINEYDNFFIKETKYCIASDIFKISDTRVTNGVLNFYKRNWWTKRIAPNVLTRYVRKYIWRSKDWEVNSNGKKYLALPIFEMDKDGITGFFKAGFGGSWKNGMNEEKLNASIKDLEASSFVIKHGKWFRNKKWPSKWWAIGVWIKKLTFNY